MIHVPVCKCGQIREARSFCGWKDFDAFVTSLEASGAFTPVPVGIPYSNVGLSEHWYQCNTCQMVWRLVEPDAPFAGIWEQVLYATSK